MTNLLILHPDLGAKTKRLFTSNENEFYPTHNVLKGEKWQCWKSNVNVNVITFVVDLGLGNTGSANFLLLSKIDLLRTLVGANTINLYLEGSNDNVTFTTILSAGSVTALTLTGNRLQEYFSTFALSTAYRYFRIQFSGVTAVPFTIGKIYFGQYMDLGVEPSTFDMVQINTERSDFIASTGMIYPGRTTLPRWQITAEWRGVSNAAADRFMNEIDSRRSDTPIFFATQTNHGIMQNLKVLCCKLTAPGAMRSRPSARDNWNVIRCSFIEALG